MQWIDITYPINDVLLIYPGDPVFEKSSFLSIKGGALCNVGKISLGCHTGTHMDAPYHFVETGRTIDAVDLSRVNGPVRVIEYTGSKRDVDREFLESVKIQPGERLLFKTANSVRFAGTTLLNDYTAFSPDGAQYLAEQQVACIGIDYMTIEPADSKNGVVHKTILGADIPVIESLDLRQVSPGIYDLYCLPLKLEGMDGSPVRALLTEVKKAVANC